MEDWCGGTPDSRSKWSDQRGAAQRWEDAHRETSAAAALTCNRPEQGRGETLGADAREFQPRRAAADDLG